MIVTPYTKNAKKHPKKQIEQVAKSIKEFDCVNCHKTWKDYKSNDRNKRFCSIACKSAFSRVERTCKNCDKKFTICKTLIDQSNATGNYCSRPCYISKITTGLTKNKNGFRTISYRIRKTKPLCALCGTGEKIHIHHIEPYRYTQNNSLDNLIPLCVSHHKVVEHQTETLLKIDDHSRVFGLMKNMLLDRQQHTAFVCR